MSKEIDIAALRKAAQEVIAFADSRVPGWEQDAGILGSPRMTVTVPVPALVLTALLDRLEQAEKERNELRHIAFDQREGRLAALERLAQAEKDAARYRWLRDGHAYWPEEHYIRGGDALDELVDGEMQGEGV